MAVPPVGDLLDGHVVLDVQYLDRIYLNGYVPNLQVAGQVVSVMRGHPGYPIPSPAILERFWHRVSPVGERVRRGRAHPGGAFRA